MGKMMYTIALVLGIALIVFTSVFMFSRDETVVRKSQDINTTLESSNVGTLRASFEDDYKNKYGIDPELAIKRLEEEIASEYSGMEKLKLDYVFLDEKGNNYTLEEAKTKDVVGYQFKVTVYNSKGEEVSTTSERRILDKKVAESKEGEKK